jgi:hypothetical protein
MPEASTYGRFIVAGVTMKKRMHRVSRNEKMQEQGGIVGSRLEDRGFRCAPWRCSPCIFFAVHSDGASRLIPNESYGAVDPKP